MKKEENKIIEQFQQNFPLMSDQIKQFRGLGDSRIEIHYEDGSIGIFDGYLNSLQYFPFGKKPVMTESRWRKELGHKIFRTVNMKGIPLYRLSEMSGISESSISQYVNGKATPSSYTLKKIAVALGVTVGYLTDFEKYYE